MNRYEFEVLSALAEKREISQTDTVMKLSDVDTENIIKQLEVEGLLQDDIVTDAGFLALEPYKVRRVIFLAAGFGSRMVPITINTPKPLVRVHDKRIIDTLIDAVLAAGIEEIYIVRGYLGEQFELLQKKYPMIRLINNPDYESSGTISSFYYAKDLLDHAYVMESDLVVNNPRIVRKYHYISGFMGSKTNETDDWFLKTDDHGLITEIGIGGSGENCYKLVGISYWNNRDGKELSSDIKKAYEGPNGHMLPMSHVPFRIYRDKYQVSIMPCSDKDVIEIDSFEELQEFDEAYQIRRDGIRKY